jgi:hypothetical protein
MHNLPEGVFLSIPQARRFELKATLRGGPWGRSLSATDVHAHLAVVRVVKFRLCLLP